MNAPNREYIAASVVASLVLLLFIVHVSGTVRWWNSDDPQVLRQAIRFPASWNFTNPSVAAELTPMHATPLVTLSHRIDWLLAGLHPTPFYVHQWLAVLMALALFYLLARRWLSRPAAAFATLCLLSTRPMLEATDLLMTRHYVEGLFLTLAATLFFLRTPYRWTHSLAASFCYALACTAKEIFVPLPALLIFLPHTTLRERTARLVPLFLVATLYTVWRFHMLGMLGGYGTPVSPSEVVRLPLSILQHAGLPPYAALATLLGIAHLTLVARRRWKVFALAASVTAFAPIVPVSGMLTGRYALIPSLLIAGYAGVACERLRLLRHRPIERILTAAAATALIATLLASNLGPHRLALRTHHERLRIEGQFILEQGGSTDLLLDPAGAPWYYQGLEWLRTNTLAQAPGPSASFDHAHLFERDLPENQQFFRYDKERHAIQPVHSIHQERQDWRARTKPHQPLQIETSMRGTLLSWKLGPYTEGRYSFILEDSLCFPQPPNSHRYIRPQPRFSFRVKYESPEGWQTYSPLLTLDGNPATLEWSR